MIRVIGGGDPPEGLKELLGLMGEGQQENVSVPGDIAMLAERAVERTRRNHFAPGEFVQMRAPDGLGIRNAGPYVVIRTLPEPISVHENSERWEAQTFSQTEADIVVGMIMRSGPQGDAAYREIYTWSGLLARYPLDEDGEEMAAIGREAANHPPKPAVKAAQEDVSPAVAAVRASLRQNPWGSQSED